MLGLSRLKLRRTLLWTAFVLLPCTLGVWAFVVEPAQLVIKKTAITLQYWHQKHHNLKVAVLTGLHVAQEQ